MTAHGTISNPILLDHMVVVKPIFLSNGTTTAVLSNAATAAKFSLFQQATQEIFAQAGIRVVWESSTTYTNATYFNLNGSGFGGDPVAEMQSLARTGGHSQSTNSNTLNIWFTSTASSLGVSEQSDFHAGNTFDPENGVTVSETMFANNYLNGIAHEMAHSLGLFHDAGSTNLMYPTTSASPMTLTDITDPFAGGLDLAVLTPTQISDLYLATPYVRANTTANDYYTYAIPEPQHYAIIAGLLTGLYAMKRKRIARSDRESSGL